MEEFDTIAKINKIITEKTAIFEQLQRDMSDVVKDNKILKYALQKNGINIDKLKEDPEIKKMGSLSILDASSSLFSKS